MAADRHTYRITGGVPLRGTVEASGAKNAVTKELVATLLTDEPCTLHGVPRILEVDLVLGMLAELGTEVTWLGEHTVRVHTPKVANTSLSSAYSGVNRIPILMMGPLLHRRGETVVPLPGGCTIGKRPIDFHLEGLHQMGADIVDRPGSVKVTATRLTGAHVHLPFPSVGATENLLLAAALAKGTTVISNAAVEPEIVDLVLMLQKMGALITIDTDRTLTISGVDELRGVEHTTVADRIEIASFAAAAVATDGRIEVRGARQDHLITFLNALRHIGGEFTETENGLEFFRGRPLTATDIETGVHPGFMTDWQQPITVLLTQATGTSVVHETIYEDRFGYAEQLSRSMGADIELTTRCLGATACRWHNRDFQHTAKINGPTQLKAADLVIPDLRAGFGYVLAALVADGTSTISGTRYLERGYEEPVAKLAAVGARITTQPA
ncbi:UDP-N-acetylglucosamine 1-carboxyvinyltransferase [Streptomyces sp. OM5714]|uniref:UDP-N-acetylglucosamine 1-carboxyvinyltransferase n=1 Tax=Streptomyces sp. OM5714 TaxID=2602736 RepID=UPI001969CFAA|nr:UDP-N-acetylglucosamine 1-carboxyvinyltransferase [Streptomyces sp. OM5714]KAF2774925.1 UDP-N-acetylglucosamine 1-carboxyvinyltransferase [Streptomyces sp. OM5714]